VGRNVDHLHAAKRFVERDFASGVQSTWNCTDVSLGPYELPVMREAGDG
jgi:hypothetical protein